MKQFLLMLFVLFCINIPFIHTSLSMGLSTNNLLLSAGWDIKVCTMSSCCSHSLYGDDPDTCEPEPVSPRTRRGHCSRVVRLRRDAERTVTRRRTLCDRGENSQHFSNTYYKAFLVSHPLNYATTGVVSGWAEQKISWELTSCTQYQLLPVSCPARTLKE